MEIRLEYRFKVLWCRLLQIDFKLNNYNLDYFISEDELGVENF